MSPPPPPPSPPPPPPNPPGEATQTTINYATTISATSKDAFDQGSYKSNLASFLGLSDPTWITLTVTEVTRRRRSLQASVTLRVESSITPPPSVQQSSIMDTIVSTLTTATPTTLTAQLGVSVQATEPPVEVTTTVLSPPPTPPTPPPLKQGLSSSGGDDGAPIAAIAGGAAAGVLLCVLVVVVVRNKKKSVAKPSASLASPVPVQMMVGSTSATSSTTHDMGDAVELEQKDKI